MINRWIPQDFFMDAVTVERQAATGRSVYCSASTTFSNFI